MGINKLNRPGSLDQQVNTTKKMQKDTKLMTGYYGCKWVGDGASATNVGDWYAIQGIDSCVIDVSGCGPGALPPDVTNLAPLGLISE